MLNSYFDGQSIRLKYLAESQNGILKSGELLGAGNTLVFGAGGEAGFVNEKGMPNEYLGIVKDGAGVGRVGLYPKNSLLVNTMSYIFPKQNIDIGWLLYAIMSLDLGNDAGKTTIPHIYFSDYGNKFVRFIAPLKQRHLSVFLDKKCDEINSLIAVEEAQIEKLNGYRLSLITETVSKGLSCPTLVASGVDWIESIPKGWRIQKVLSQLDMPITDGPHTTPELFAEGVAFVSAEAVSCGNGRIDFNRIRGFISEEFYQECCSKYVPEIDDVYMIKSGATTGRVSIVDTLEPKFTIWSPLAVMRCNKNKMLPKFLFYAVQSIHFQRQIALGWSFGTQQNLGMRTLEQLKLIVPPFNEQKEIVKHLDDKLASIASLIDVKRSKIERLNEYKQSLIYEYVTGKKTVA